MSGNRANAAAIQRRTMGAQNNVAPPGGARPMQGQQQMQQQQMQQQQMRQPVGRQGQQMPQQQQQKQMQQQPMQNPKMSVSDAIGLISLRLGRVETFIQQMPPLDQIGMNSSSESGGEVGENMRVVDEAVFTNIVARLEKLEHTPKTQVVSPLPAVVASVATPSPLNVEQLNEVNHSIDVLKAEMLQVKELLLSLQSFTMQTNQKLVDLVINDNINDNINDDDVDGDNEILDNENVVEASLENDLEYEGDGEILAGNIDLKAFVESSI
jgi:hypothetical protein